MCELVFLLKGYDYECAVCDEPVYVSDIGEFAVPYYEGPCKSTSELPYGYKGVHYECYLKHQEWDEKNTTEEFFYIRRTYE